MKKIFTFCVFATLCLVASVNAQNINKIEYFIDADPGYGAGTDVPITTSTPVTVSFSVELDTYLTLADSDGLTVISENDNSNPNGFSKIIFTACANSLILTSINSPSDDINSGTVTKQVNATTGTITATNKITGTAIIEQGKV